MKLIIDTDPGIDDAMAIAYAAAAPEFDLIGLTTVFGNTHVHQSSRNARFLLDKLGWTFRWRKARLSLWGLTCTSHRTMSMVPKGLVT